MKTKTAMKIRRKCHHNTDEDQNSKKGGERSDHQLLIPMKQRKSTRKINTVLIFKIGGYSNGFITGFNLAWTHLPANR
jgi:hypothetical protein